jgi:hypothetical protein
MRSVIAFSDDLYGYPVNRPFRDGNTFGDWTSAFCGFGENSIVESGSSRCLRLAPLASEAPDVTHAGLILGTRFGNALTFEASVTNLRQLRRNSKPNTWEVGWLLWSATDVQHAYYFVGKETGWELGKLDPAYPGGQRFLATGENMKFPLNQRFSVSITQTDATMSVTVNGVLLTTFTDQERAYMCGNIGVYCEDSEVIFDGIRVSVPQQESDFYSRPTIRPELASFSPSDKRKFKSTFTAGPIRKPASARQSASFTLPD